MSWLDRFGNIASVLLVVLVGIPTAVEFYPAIFSNLIRFFPDVVDDFANILPISSILTIMFSIGVLLLIIIVLTLIAPFVPLAIRINGRSEADEKEIGKEMNLTGGEWSDESKENKQFSDEVLDEVAEVMADGRSTDEIADLFEIVGFDVDEMRYNLRHDDPLQSKAESHSNRVYIAKEKLQELNSEDYRHVLKVIQKAADPKQYIGEEEKHQEVVEKLNTALEFEDLRVVDDGRIFSIKESN